MPLSRFDLTRLSPQPAAIYLGLFRDYGDDYSQVLKVGMGFNNHETVIPLSSQVVSPYFKWCNNCVYRKNYEQDGPPSVSCVGGYQYIREASDVVRNYADYNSAGYPKLRNCIARNAREITDISMNQTLSVPVKLPAYALISSTSTGRSYPLQAFVLNPESEDLEDLTKGIPFVFGNVNAEDASVCTGSLTQSLTDWSSFASIQNGFLSFERNYDWTSTWVYASGKPPETLVEYATRLSEEGAYFVNDVVDEDVADWTRNFDLYNSGQEAASRWDWIALPYTPNMATIQLSSYRKNWAILDADNNILVSGSQTHES